MLVCRRVYSKSREAKSHGTKIPVEQGHGPMFVAEKDLKSKCSYQTIFELKGKRTESDVWGT